nr:macro domain-containing protein [Clostridia bacterium]
MQTAQIIRKSITDLDTEIIVNAANKYLRAGGGVCGYIFDAAGYDELRKACEKIGGCKTGSAVITPGFKLCKYIVHAVGPEYIDGKHGEPEQLRGCYKKALDLAKEYDCHSIGFPLISSGIFGYPVYDAWKQAVQAIAEWTKEDPDYDIRIVFAVIDNGVLEKGRNTLAEYAEGLFLVKKEDWKTCEMPEQKDRFELMADLSDKQLDILRHGHLPKEMEDKWFWYMEDDVLYAHRSWTGHCIYIADLSQKGRFRITVNRDPEQYRCTDIQEDKEKFKDLLSWWLQEPYDHYNEWLHETVKTLEKAGMIKDQK